MRLSELITELLNIQRTTLSDSKSSDPEVVISSDSGQDSVDVERVSFGPADCVVIEGDYR